MNGLVRFWFVWKARNREFLRDRASLAWNILLPLLIVFGFAFAYTGDGPAQYRVGLYGAAAAESDPLGDLPHIRRVPVMDLDTAIVKVERHQLDLLLDVPGEHRPAVVDGDHDAEDLEVRVGPDADPLVRLEQVVRSFEGVERRLNRHQ